MHDPARARWGELYIPPPSREERDQAIRDAVACGLTVAECARRYAVTRATVYRVLGT
ncbi:MAG: hypothetical protein WBG92_20570 [Thiohalocapsa sp.]